MRAIVLFVVAATLAAAARPFPAAAANAAANECVAPGGWIDGDGDAVADAAVLRDGARAPIVVLGESHDSAEDHRWQLQTLAGLHALNPKLAVGMEMFPRRLQPILDRWSAGELDETAFLKLAEWDKVWGYDSGYYLPILHFARMRRLPLIALNVERALVSRTAREGWGAIPPADREGVGDPAPVSDAYRARLAKVAAGHAAAGQEEQPQTSPELDRFIQAQSAWDRAMAEAAAAAHRRDGRTVAVIVGRGHAERRDGMIRQLADLGLPNALVWLPWAPGRECNTAQNRIADAMFGAAPPAASAPPPRLGVEMRPADGGLNVAAVAPGSVAARAGIKAGDVIVTAAGSPVSKPADLIGLIRAMPAGAWLPLEVRRGGRTKTLTAKFPPAGENQ